MQRILICTFPENLAGPQRFLAGLLGNQVFCARFAPVVWHVPDRYRHLRGKWRLFQNARTQLTASKAEVVYLNLDLSLAFWLCLGFRLAGARRVVTRALSASYASPSNSIMRFLYKCGLTHLAHQRLAVSEEAAKAMYTGDFARAIVIPCLIDFDSLHRDAAIVPSRQRMPGEHFVFGCVGRLVVEKNQALIIRALARLRLQGLDAGLLLVGEGEDRPALEALAAAEGIADSVVFMGSTGNIGAVYRGRLDALLVPSLYEGQGRIVAEAQSFGLPMALSQHVPGMAVLDDKGVIVGLPLEVDAWVEAMRRLMQMPRCAARPLQELNRHKLSLSHGVPVFCEVLSGC